MKSSAKIKFINSKRTWILVADRSHATIFQPENAQNTKFKVVSEWDHPKGRLKDGDLNSDRPGRTKDRFGRGKHSMSKEFSPTRQAAIEFSETLAEILNQGRLKDRMDEIILVCPPTLLGLLRETLHRETKKLVRATIKKDILKQTQSEIKTQLKSLLEKI